MNTQFVSLQWTGKNRYRASNEDRTKENREDILVKRDTEGSWAPVAQLDGEIDKFTLEKDYAIWRDQETYSTKNVDLRWTNGEPNTTREIDGIIQADEIKTFKRLEEGLRTPTERDSGWLDQWADAIIA